MRCKVFDATNSESLEHQINAWLDREDIRPVFATHAPAGENQNTQVVVVFYEAGRGG